MNNYKLTLIGLSLSVIVFLSTIILGADIFELFISTLERFERFEIDEILIPIAIFGVFAFIDMVRRLKANQIEREKIKIYKAMMSAIHHILNNFLHQMQLFKMTAEDTPGFDHEVLSLYDQVIDEASTQIGVLGSITRIDEVSISTSVSPQSHAQVRHPTCQFSGQPGLSRFENFI